MEKQTRNRLSEKTGSPPANNFDPPVFRSTDRMELLSLSAIYATFKSKKAQKKRTSVCLKSLGDFKPCWNIWNNYYPEYSTRWQWDSRRLGKWCICRAVPIEENKTELSDTVTLCHFIAIIKISRYATIYIYIYISVELCFPLLLRLSRSNNCTINRNKISVKSCNVIRMIKLSQYDSL